MGEDVLLSEPPGTLNKTLNQYVVIRVLFYSYLQLLKQPQDKSCLTYKKTQKVKCDKNFLSKIVSSPEQNSSNNKKQYLF